MHSYTADAGWGSGGAVISWPWRRRGGVSPQEAVGKKIEAMERLGAVLHAALCNEPTDTAVLTALVPEE